MSSKDILKLYDEVKDNLKFISSSSVRTRIMISLTMGITKLKDLKEGMNVDSSTILHAMKTLEDQNLIIKTGDEYFISQTGKIIGLKLIDTIKMLFTVKRSEKLWLNHEIEDIPADLLLKIGELNVSTLIESEPTDIFKPHENYFSRILINSNKIRGLSPIFNQDFIEPFKLMMEEGKEIELILTPQVINETMNVLDPDSMLHLADLISQDKFKIWTIEDVKVAFTVTDKFISLGLYSKSGEYDNTRDLVSDHPDAIEWGNILFEYYRDKADRFNI